MASDLYVATKGVFVYPSSSRVSVQNARIARLKTRMAEWNVFSALKIGTPRDRDRLTHHQPLPHATLHHFPPRILLFLSVFSLKDTRSTQ